ncbi:unnamed protein product [Bursaphelenchus okinawaensis]|uniref:Uncharacterized protein n=1 Tax=Bursaphelenchus okinawaensis TaxID=465554 RepID=A0A811LR01_9BILA|nr:unnamed protein product [Bursaphelenchus okinawaensis]CAG9126773.1 unnamed protein product [Bursaphelenchus okinawaensis]
MLYLTFTTASTSFTIPEKNNFIRDSSTVSIQNPTNILPKKNKSVCLHQQMVGDVSIIAFFTNRRSISITQKINSD